MNVHRPLDARIGRLGTHDIEVHHARVPITIASYELATLTSQISDDVDRVDAERCVPLHRFSFLQRVHSTGNGWYQTRS